MSSNLIQQLNKLSIEPRKEWVERTRSELFARVQTTSQPNIKKAFIWKELGYSYLRESMQFRFSGVGFLVLVIFLSGYITKVAASDALPGEALYRFKRANEGVTKAVIKIVNEDKLPELELSFASRRLDEAEKIASSTASSEEKKEKVKTAVAEVKTHVQNAQNQLDSLSNKGNTEDTVLVASIVDANIKNISNSLASETSNLVTLGEETVKEDVQTVVADTVKAVDEASADTLELLVTKYESGESGISKEEITSKIQVRIEDLKKQTLPAPAPKPQEIPLPVSSNTPQEPTSSTDVNSNETQQNSLPETSVPPGQSVPKEQPLEETKPSETTLNISEPTNTIPPAQDKPSSSEAPNPEEQPKLTIPQVQALLDEAKTLLEQGDISKSFERIKHADEALKILKPVAPETINPPTSTLEKPIDEKQKMSNNEAPLNSAVNGEVEVESSNVNSSLSSGISSQE